MTTSHRHHLLGVAALAAGITLFSACGSSGSGTSTASSPIDAMMTHGHDPFFSVHSTTTTRHRSTTTTSDDSSPTDDPTPSYEPTTTEEPTTAPASPSASTGTGSAAACTATVTQIQRSGEQTATPTQIRALLEACPTITDLHDAVRPYLRPGADPTTAFMELDRAIAELCTADFPSGGAPPICQTVAGG